MNRSATRAEDNLRKLTIVFHHAGGGHRNAAEALKSTLSARSNPWDVELLDIQQLLDPLDLIRRATGVRIQDTYNLILRRGWTRFTPELLKVLQTTIRLYHGPITKALRQYWTEHPADVVLSVIPHFNREIAESVQAQLPGAGFVTLLTDLADYSPRFWIEKNSQYIIAGTERARSQALAMGHPEENVYRASGMVLKPKFYEELAVDRVSERKRHGLDPDCPTGIVLFGGHGARVMLDITKRLDRGGANVQLILICGHNQKLAAELNTLKTRRAKLVEGFTTNVEYYMALSDFFIGKPGPGSISEALQLHLPVIVECNAKTLPQERYNAEWVAESGYGIVVKSFCEIAKAVEKLLAEMTQFEERTAQYSNRALFDVAEILDICYERSTGKAAVQPAMASLSM